jgi:lipid A ethanolaminephosphotransferase
MWISENRKSGTLRSSTTQAPMAPWTWTASTETAALVLSLFWLLSANRTFLGTALKGHGWGDASAWGFAVALAMMVLALHFLLLALVGVGHAFKPLAALLIVGTAFASHFMDRFGVYLDPSMLRNVLRTDTKEAGELFSWSLLPHLAWQAGLPLLALWRLRLVPKSPSTAGVESAQPRAVPTYWNNWVSISTCRLPEWRKPLRRWGWASCLRRIIMPP